MKKLIFTLAAVYALGATAQQGIQGPNVFGSPANIPAKPQKTTFDKFQIIDWYNPIQMFEASNIGADLESFVNFMYHDSLAVFVRDDGSRDFVGATTIGQILDPKDDLIDLTNNPALKLSKYVSYTVDSLRFTYIYARNTDSIDDGLGGKLPVVDTLFIAYYRGNQITRDFYNVPGKKNAVVGWTGGAVRMPSNTFKIDTVLFEPGTTDTTTVLNNNNGFENSWRLKSLTVPAPTGLSVDAQNGLNNNNLVAATITFKSGVRTVIDVNGTPDTAVMVYQLDPSTFPVGGRRTNYFGYLTFNNQGTTEISRPTFYTSSLISYPQYAYATSGTRGYIPGHLYNVEQYIDMDFHLTTSDNVGLKDLKQASFGMTNVYPNPASVNGTALVGVNFKQAGNATVAIYNIAGQLVKAIAPQSFAAGEHAIEMDLTGLNAGIYMVTVTVNGESQTKRLTIAE